MRLTCRRGVLEVVDRGVDLGVLAAVEDHARRVDARAHHAAGLDHLGLREDVDRRRRRIVGRRDAVGEIRQVLPLGLRVVLEGRVVEMGMGVDEPRDDRLAGGVERSRAGGHRDAPAAPTATMRSSVTTTSAASSTSSPFIVTTRAFLQHEGAGGLRPRHGERDRISSDFGSFRSGSFSSAFSSSFLSFFALSPPAFAFSAAFRFSSARNSSARVTGSRWKLAPRFQVSVFPPSVQLRKLPAGVREADDRKRRARERAARPSRRSSPAARRRGRPRRAR